MCRSRSWSPVLANEPKFSIASLYERVVPTRKSCLLWLLSMPRSTVVTGTVTVSESFAELTSSSVLTVAVLITSGTASASTATSSVMSPASAPASTAPLRVHVTAWATAPQLQPAPVALW